MGNAVDGEGGRKGLMADAEVRRAGRGELGELAGFCLPAYPGGKGSFANPAAAGEYPPAVQREMYRERLAWLSGAMTRGLVAFLAGPPQAAFGLAEGVPVEAAPRRVRGRGLLFLTCLWVEPADRRGRGVGRALLTAFEDEARRLGKGGVATLGYAQGGHKPAGFFRRWGYAEIDRRGDLVLLFKALAPDARPPEWLGAGGPGPKIRAASDPARGGEAPRHRLELIWSGQCPYFWAAAHAVREWAAAHTDLVEFSEHRSDDPAAADRLGTAGGVFLDGRQVDQGHRSRREIFDLLDECCGVTPPAQPGGAP